jgi:hypothetical protein
MGEMKNAFKMLVEGKRPLERPRCRWRIILNGISREVWIDIVDWMDLA